MRSVPLTDGWSVTPKRGLFDGMNGGPVVAEPVTLPHDAMLALERSADATSGVHSGYYPGGAVEYTRDLDLGPDAADRVHTLVFDGVHRDAMVFVNDHYAAQQPFGYTRFAVPLDPFLRFDGPNTIRVEARAHRDSRWYTGLGIHRNVAIVTAPRVHVALNGVQVTTPEVTDAEAMVVVETTVTNDSLHTSTAIVTVQVEGPDGVAVAGGRNPITLLAGESGVARLRLAVDAPALWNLGQPLLHTARVTVEAGGDVDDETVTFGIRRLQLDARRGLRINGETVKLRGACIHHDNGIIGARSIARAETRRIELLKAAGFNAIRSAHNPLSTELLDACDRVGMLVMDESFDVWAEAKSTFDYSLAFPEWWERDLESMVAKDFNHPSVVFYSIGNEIPETGRPHGSRLGRLLAEKLHGLDPTRFTTNSINGVVSVIREMPAPGSGEEPQGINDMGTMMTALASSELVTQRTEESFAAVDAAGLNYGDSRYAIDAELFPNRVIIGSETFSTRIDITWPLVLANDNVIGDFTWTGWDYLGEAGIGRVDHLEDGAAYPGTAGPFPWRLAWCGDIDITGHRRPASYYREIVFGLRRAPYLAVRRPRTDDLVPVKGPWSWSDSVASWSWPVAPGTVLDVELYSDADEVELQLDGVSVGTVPTGAANRYRGEIAVAFAPGELVAIARTAGVEMGRETLRSATGSVSIDVRAERPEIVASPTDLAFVPITLIGENGETVIGLDRRVEVQVSGPATLLGLGSGRPDDDESYLTNAHDTFDGRAMAIVRPTGAGEIIVTVTADGCETRSVAVSAIAP